MEVRNVRRSAGFHDDHNILTHSDCRIFPVRHHVTRVGSRVRLIHASSREGQEHGPWGPLEGPLRESELTECDYAPDTSAPERNKRGESEGD